MTTLRVYDTVIAMSNAPTHNSSKPDGSNILLGLSEFASKYFREKYLDLKKRVARMQRDFDSGLAVSYGELVKLRKIIAELDEAIMLDNTEKVQQTLLKLAEADRDVAAKNYHDEAQILLDQKEDPDFAEFKRLTAEENSLLAKVSDEKFKKYLADSIALFNKLTLATDRGRIEMRRNWFQANWAKLDDVVVSLGGKTQK